MTDTANTAEIAADAFAALARPRLCSVAAISCDLLRARLGEAPADRVARGVLGGAYAVEIVLPPAGDPVAVTEAFLASRNLTFGAALEQAVTALARVPRVPVTKYDGRVFAIQSGDGFDAARLIFCHRLFCEAGLVGPVVALAPHADIVLAAGAEDAEGLVLLAKIAAEHADRPNPLPGVALVRDDAGWLPFTPPVGHKARDLLHGLAVRSQLRDAEEQREVLERLWGAEGRRVHPAKLHAMEERATGRVLSVTTWSEGIALAIPRADLVTFVPSRPSATDVPFFVPWENVDSIVGSAFRDLGLLPERYIVLSSPTPRELAALRARAVAV